MSFDFFPLPPHMNESEETSHLCVARWMHCPIMWHAQQVSDTTAVCALGAVSLCNYYTRDCYSASVSGLRFVPHQFTICMCWCTIRNFFLNYKIMNESFCCYSRVGHFYSVPTLMVTCHLLTCTGLSPLVFLFRVYKVESLGSVVFPCCPLYFTVLVSWYTCVNCLLWTLMAQWDIDHISLTQQWQLLVDEAYTK